MNKILKNISLSEIIPYEKNNKKHWKNVDEIIKSIQANTYITPIIIDENNIILAWHGRKLALDKLQVKETEVLQVSGLSEEQKRDFRIRDNKLTELSEWDRDNLKFELDDLNIPDLTDLFKDEEEMEEETPEAKEDDFEVDDQIKTDIVLWDLFEIGEHRLLCGDSTNEEQVSKLMNWYKADTVFTDPPYNLQQRGQTKRTNKSKNKREDFWEWDIEFNPLDVIPNINKFSADNSNIYICTSSYLFWPIHDELEKLEMKPNYIVWCKNNPMPSLSKNRFVQATELIVHGVKWKPIFNYPSWENLPNYFNWNVEPHRYWHPAQKPIYVVDNFISRDSWSVLDLFLWSWSTMVACHKINRKCYWMELDPKYVQTIINRMHKLDPSLTFKKNWQTYNPETNDYLLDK